VVSKLTIGLSGAVEAGQVHRHQVAPNTAWWHMAGDARQLWDG